MPKCSRNQRGCVLRPIRVVHTLDATFTTTKLSKIDKPAPSSGDGRCRFDRGHFPSPSTTTAGEGVPCPTKPSPFAWLAPTRNRQYNHRSKSCQRVKCRAGKKFSRPKPKQPTCRWSQERSSHPARENLLCRGRTYPQDRGSMASGGIISARDDRSSELLPSRNPSGTFVLRPIPVPKEPFRRSWFADHLP